MSQLWADASSWVLKSNQNQGGNIKDTQPGPESVCVCAKQLDHENKKTAE